MTADTATLSYWLNWRFLLGALFILTSMVLAAIIIWKFEGRKSENQDRQNLKKAPGLLYEDETWNTCLKGIHPAWLLSFRVFAFIILLALLMANIVIRGAGIFYFYTQWTFTLVMIYFGVGSAISIYGCQKHWRKVGGDRADNISLDFEQGTYLPPTLGDTANASNQSKHFDAHEAPYNPPRAGALTYVFQIIYQVAIPSLHSVYFSFFSKTLDLTVTTYVEERKLTIIAVTGTGAVMLTDSVFWLILFPFLTSKDYGLNSLVVCMHSINAVFLLGDTSLNCMRFPSFRIAYFVLWTDTFVIFQWIIHACVSFWWPYPFLDLSSSYAPLWYLGVGLMQIPCYGIFSLIIKLKDFSLSRSFPDSYRKLR